MRILTLFFALLYCTNKLNAQIDPLFGLNGRVLIDKDSIGNFPQFVRSTLDNGFIVCMMSNSPSLEHHLIKYKSDGSVDSSFANGLFSYHQFPGMSTDGFYNIIQLPDSNYLLFGVTSTNPSNAKHLVLSLDQFGDIDPLYNLDGEVLFNLPAGQVYPRIAFQDIDGKYLVSGEVPVSFGSSELYITRHKSDGEVDSSFNGIGYLVLNPPDSAFRPLLLTRVNSDQYMIIGRTDNTFPQKILYIRFNNNGTLDNTFGINGIKQIIPSIQFLPGTVIHSNQSFYLGGMYLSSTGKQKAAVMKTDIEGVSMVSFGANGIDTTFLLPDSISTVTSLVFLTNNQLMISGYLFTDTVSLFVSQKDSNSMPNIGFGLNGTIRLITDSSTNDFGGHACVLSEGSLVCAGYYTKQNSLTQEDISICKILPQLPMSISEMENNQEYIIFPNPSSSLIQINHLYDHSDVFIKDMLGNTIHHLRNINQRSIQIQVHGLSSGIYFCEIRNEKIGRKVMKFQVEGN